MAHNVTNVLRRERQCTLARAEGAEATATRMEADAAQLRSDAAELRALHCQLGASIQVLDGDAAPLDFPEEPKAAIAATV